MKGGGKKPIESELKPLSRYSGGIGNVGPAAHAHLAACAVSYNYGLKNHAQVPHSVLFRNQKTS